MNDREIRTATKRAIAYGKARGLSEEQSEDLAQRWVIKVFVDKTGQRLEQAYVDFLRIEYGDTRNLSGSVKSSSRRTQSDLIEGYHRTESAYCEYTRYDDFQHQQRKLKLLSFKEESIVKAIENGFQQREVADILGVTEGRISQILTVIRDKISVVDLEKELKVDWITL